MAVVCESLVRCIGRNAQIGKNWRSYMKKSLPLSYRSKKKKTGELMKSLNAHYKSLQDNYFFIDDSVHNYIDNSLSNLSLTSENNIVESNNSPNNNDFIYKDDSLTDNINKTQKHNLNIENVNDMLNINISIDDDFIFDTEKSFSSELDARTTLHTKLIKLSKMQMVDPGKYYHFGIENGINRYFSTFNVIDQSTHELNLVSGIDGLPISKSNSNQFWLISAYLRSKSNVVFPVGLYFGTEKPKDRNDFLKDFVDEAKHLVNNGLVINNSIYKILFDVFYYDTPVKVFILKVKGHNGFFSCTRYEIEGEYKEDRLCFPYCDISKREAKQTHNNYVNQTDIYHHSPYTTISKIVEISGINICNEKLLLLWIKGPLSVHLPSSKIKQLTNLSLSFKFEFPCEFSRKLRSLVEVARWKATEFRSFLLYTGPVILKSIVPDNCLKNFKALNIAMIKLLSPNCRSFVQYSDELLNYFVETFEEIYGRHFVSSNIHGLIHLVDDYKHLNKNITVQSSDNGLLLGPHNDGPLLNGCANSQFSSLIFNSFKIKCKIDADSYFVSKTNEIIKLINIAHSHNTNEVVLIGKQFEIQEIF
ncbi:Uncharacterized protein FWK35_00025027 [Aphis craccivora]|uniref:DUF4806 domain-containing protein n=1 Tax=Aphis craccivora TaxID=307492 RepID=A0A6G0Y6K3_APHCR|nr:Uncharacterized protein FWK35_00025027 [Aphis craccivora]